MGGCCFPSGMTSSSPILFFATSNEVTTGNLIGAGEVPVLTLGVSPASPGSHQTKLDSTVELLLTANNNPDYSITYRLRRSDSVTPLATLQIIGRLGGGTAGTLTEIPNLTWNDTISTSVTYTVTIQVITSTNLTSVTAQTKALNAIVF
jgi:hypothetical protein